MQNHKVAGRYVYKKTEVYKGEHFICVGTSTKGITEAKKSYERRLSKKRNEIDGKIEKEEKGEILSESIREWHQQYKAGSVNARTLIRHMTTINQICDSTLGELHVMEITTDDVQSFFVSLVEAGYSESVIKKCKDMLNMFFTNKRPSTNPIGGCILPKSKKETEEKPAYSDEEIRKITEQLSKPYDPSKRGADRGSVNGRMLVVALYEYLRIGELQEIRVKDVDFSHGLLHIERQYDETTGEIKAPKYKSARALPISKEIWGILEAQVEGKNPEDLVFPSGTTLNQSSCAWDNHVRANNLRDCLYHAEDYAGLDHHTVHDLRHDGISYFVRKGYEAVDISRFAGHKDVSFTLRRYYRHTKDINLATIKRATGRDDIIQ